jgi:hypothetical protein
MEELAGGDGAVVGGEFFVGEDGEAGVAEGGGGLLREESVLEAAAGEEDLRGAGVSGDVEDGGHKGIMEHCGLVCGGFFGREEGFEEGLPVGGDEDGCGGGGLAGGEFEGHGGFAFKAGSGAEAEESGGGVEEAAGGGGWGGVQFLKQQGLEELEFGLREERFCVMVEGEFVEDTEERAAGLSDGLLAAGEEEGAEVGGAGDAGTVVVEELAAPDGCVRAEAGAVPDDGKEGRLDVMFEDAGEEVGGVVLDGVNGELEGFGGFGGAVVGVEVAGDGGRAELIDAGEVVEGAVVGFEGGEGGEVAEVLGEEDEAAAGEGDGVFHVGAGGERLGEIDGGFKGEGGVAAGAAEEDWA